ncbi:MAG: VOC family protein [archaeon]|jgi:catechol 2,3-dioxygenase-like lactoylglutathione lyase family enzyme
MKFNKLIPELSVFNLEKSLDFYVNTLGFKLEYEREENKFVFLSFEGSQIMLEEGNGCWQTGKMEKPLGRGINFQFETTSLDVLLKKLEKKNYPLYVKPQVNKYRVKNKIFVCKEFLVCDPDGYLLRFAQDI